MIGALIAARGGVPGGCAVNIEDTAAMRAAATSGDALDDLVVVDFEQHHRIKRRADARQHGPQRLRPARGCAESRPG